MNFQDLFREKFRAALCSARKNDEAAVLSALGELSKIFSEQYKKENGDPYAVKAKLRYWYNFFSDCICRVEKSGLDDPQIRKLFSLEPKTAPFPGMIDSFSEKPGEVDIRGIEPFPAEKPFTEPPAPQEPVISGIFPEPIPESEETPSLEGLQPSEGEEKPSEPVGEQVAPLPETVAMPSYEPDSLEGFIGQQHIVRTLLKEIAIAKAEGRRHLDNILLLGNPGLGKSTLMRLIAKSLGVRYEWMDCSQYRNSQQSMKALQNFLMRVARENEPVVIALDEIHMLNEELQSSLLTLLESRVYVSPPDLNGNIKRIPIEEFTFIAATTNDEKVLSTIKDRCLRLKFQMSDYSAEELAQIYRTKVAAKGLTITEEAIKACIPRSRGSIRYVNSFVEGLNSQLYGDDGRRISTHIDLSVAEKFFEERGIDPIGLEKKDLEILSVIAEESLGSIGAETLSARVGLDPRKYLSEFEPYLVRIGFISVTGRGRCLTDKAREYLKKS